MKEPEGLPAMRPYVEGRVTILANVYYTPLVEKEFEINLQNISGSRERQVLIQAKYNSCRIRMNGEISYRDQIDVLVYMQNPPVTTELYAYTHKSIYASSKNENAAKLVSPYELQRENGVYNIIYYHSGEDDISIFLEKVKIHCPNLTEESLNRITSAVQSLACANLEKIAENEELFPIYKENYEEGEALRRALTSSDRRVPSSCPSTVICCLGESEAATLERVIKSTIESSKVRDK